MDDSPAHAQLYRLDPATRNYVGLDSEGNESGALSMTEITNGRLTLRGTAVINTATGRIVSNVSTSRPSYLMDIGNGSYRIENGVDRGAITSAQYRNAQIVGMGGFTVDLSNGRQMEIEAQYFEVTAAGSSLYYNPSLDWKDAFRDIINGPEGDAMREAAILSGYTLADHDIAIERALIGYLLTHGRSQVQEAIAGGLVGEDGSFIVDESEAAVYLATINMDVVTLMSSVLVAP